MKVAHQSSMLNNEKLHRHTISYTVQTISTLHSQSYSYLVRQVQLIDNVRVGCGPEKKHDAASGRSETKCSDASGR